MKYYYDIEQNTPQWFDIKRGRFGASTAAELLMTPGTKGYQKLINRIVFERITGETAETYSNEWMERGLRLEDEAIHHYELETFNKTHKIGYVELSEFVGCSPDIFVGKEGIVQIKCPAWNTHLEYYFADKIPGNYYKQLQFELMVTGRELNTFYSYHPGLKPFIKKVQRDEKLIKEILDKLNESIELVQKRIKQLEK